MVGCLASRGCDGGGGGADVLLGSEGVVGDETVCRQAEVRQELDHQLVPLRQHRPAGRQVDRQTGRQADRQGDRQTGRHTGRHTGRQVER